ncbi:MAG: hypothetical protein WCO29_19765, partial [Nostocales cyanobacterium ELA583]
LAGEGLGERSNLLAENEDIRRNLTPLTPLPYEGMGEQEFSNSPLLAGEGLGERSNLLAENEDNFMYVQQVVKAIANGFYSANNFEQIPPDLETYYQQHWQKMQGQGLSDIAIDILRVLTAEETPAMSTVAISQIIKADVFDVAEIMETWLEFLQETHTSKETQYQLYHHSFRLYLYYYSTLPNG